MEEKEKKSVAGIAIEHGKILIARRLPGGVLGGKWEFPGGKVEPGETNEAALQREYMEELGVPVTVGPFLGTASFEYRGPHTVYAYQVYLKRGDFKLTAHTEWRWSSIAEIETLDFAESDRKLLPFLIF
ncbi:MAG: (deoxy)nucleoside triphosphate pyrophosphohydrolase [Spirochaetaceae bacterium]|jgi:8-oxo-dGTP diphosphatase|nr:(deoxy)nucleoside triphosphate pyrophosphohydrolase [Spirochaetaceae bacterium]